MPSSFRVIKNGQEDVISPFSLNGLSTFTVDEVSSGDVTLETSASVVHPSESQPKTTQAAVESPAARVTTAAWSKKHSPIIEDNQARNDIRMWVVQEFIKENRKKSDNPSEPAAPVAAPPVQDYSHLLDEAKAKADEIISTAEKNAAAILEQANTDAETIKQKAFMEGMTASRNEISQTLHQVKRIFQEAQLWQEQVMRESQGRIIDMVLAIGKKLFGNGFELPAEQIDHIVSRAINEASRLGNLRIYLNPEDAKLLVNLWQESELTINGQQIQIVSSQNISRGGCFVDGQFGIVDGRVEEQIDQINSSIKTAETNMEIKE